MGIIWNFFFFFPFFKSLFTIEIDWTHVHRICPINRLSIGVHGTIPNARKTLVDMCSFCHKIRILKISKQLKNLGSCQNGDTYEYSRVFGYDAR